MIMITTSTSSSSSTTTTVTTSSTRKNLAVTRTDSEGDKAQTADSSDRHIHCRTSTGGAGETQIGSGGTRSSSILKPRKLVLVSSSSSVLISKSRPEESPSEHHSQSAPASAFACRRTVYGKRMSIGFSGLSETCNLSRRQASILSKKRAAEELELARQQELEAELEAECSKKAKKDHAPPPPWTETDKDIFFQGVLACGRDFDKLHKFCSAKMKNKDLCERSKDQIRHFYYRTVKNIQSLVNMDRVSKNREANELFAMINWAEFRRRFCTKTSNLTRHGEKLSQLIYMGETKFKHRGKLVKIKTPTCAPLTRLFEKAKEDTNYDSTAADKRKVAPVLKKVKVPEFVSLELQPKTNAAWHRVTDICHNPHLRLKVKSEQSLSTVIESVEKKWVPSTTRFRREINLEEDWDRLPYLKLYPVSTAKLQPFDLSLYSNNTRTLLGFYDYLKINNEDPQPEDTNESNRKSAGGEMNGGDPVKFLKDKLSDITSQLQGECSNGLDEVEPKEVVETQAVPDTKSHDWIALSSNGWTTKNCVDMSVGCLHLMYGSPEKIVMEYEWPELENSDEVLHMFAGMINRLITIAENEFGNQAAKKKILANAQTSPTSTTKSPTSRGRRGSPSTPKAAPKPMPLKPAPAKDSPEFKKPGVPLQSENRQLADAIALGHQELRPYARRPIFRPKLVQKNILPNRIAVTVPATNHQQQPYYALQPKPSIANTLSTATKTHVMDVSCITTGSNGKYNPTSKLMTPVQASPRQSLQSMLANQGSADRIPTSKDQLLSSLSEFINSSGAPSSVTNSTQLTQLQSIISSAITSHAVNEADNSSQDILAQAMSSIKTPVKRRITPTMISSSVEGAHLSATSMDTVEGTSFNALPNNTLFEELLSTVERTVFVSTDSQHGSLKKQNGLMEFEKTHQLSDSISEHSLSSLLKSIDAASHPHKSGEESNHVMMDTGTAGCSVQQPLLNSFEGLISGGLNGTDSTSASAHTGALAGSENGVEHGKDAWLTPDITLNDFSLSSFLGDKSPRRVNADPSVPPGMLMSDRPSSTLGSDDTRMSFLNKLDANELEMDSSFPNILNGDSVDYMAKFESLAATLETPQKKNG